MALSFCSPNWGSLQLLNPEISSLQQPELAADHLLGFDYSSPCHLADSIVDPFLQSDELLYSDSYNNLFPYYSQSDNMIPLAPEIFLTQELDFCQYPKRQKIHANHYHSNYEQSFVHGYVPNLSSSIPEFLPEIPPPLPKFQVPVAVDNGRAESEKKPNGGGWSLSAQSIVARERRRKIIEKTQEIAKLIPGGHKMNTAEMFQAAFKYVKYLQAQLGILQLMASIQDEEEALHVQELPGLLASPAIQEKLYLEEKCLVPTKFVQALADNQDIKSDSLIFEAIDQLLQMDK